MTTDPDLEIVLTELRRFAEANRRGARAARALRDAIRGLTR